VRIDELLECEVMIFKSFHKFNHSGIRIFLIVALVSFLSLSGCAGTERFGKNDSESDSGYDEKETTGNVFETIEGVASYYSDEFHGRKTANGETYDMYALTAAHKTYSFNTEVRVTNLSNGKFVVLRINDRMPANNKRIIDVSFQAARELGMIISGIADIKLEVLKWGK
jgi:rare lipoprotein A